MLSLQGYESLMYTGILGGTAGPPAHLILAVRTQGQDDRSTLEMREVWSPNEELRTHGDFQRFFLCWAPVSDTSHALSLTLPATLSLNYTHVEVGPERYSGLAEVTQAFSLLASPWIQAQAVQSWPLLPVAVSIS